MKNKTKWYSSTWGIILALILCFPVGLVLMWLNAPWSKNVKLIITSCFIWPLWIYVIFKMTSWEPKIKVISSSAIGIMCVVISVLACNNPFINQSSDDVKPVHTADTVAQVQTPKQTQVQASVQAEPVAFQTQQWTMEERIEQAVARAIGEEYLIDVNYVEDNNFALINILTSDSINDKFTKKAPRQKMFNILKAIQPLTDYDVDINVYYDFGSGFDVYGNKMEPNLIKVIQAEFKKETIKKINFDQALWENVDHMADGIWIHNKFKI